MATTNKSLTTYLPSASREWLERYCLDYKHLLNKEGNPKLGTALADIISRLADGELTLPVKIEPISTLTDNVLIGTEISTLKSEVEDLKKLLTEYGTSKSPDTVLNLEAINSTPSEVLADDKALEELIKVSIEPLADRLAKLEASTQSQFETMREGIKALADRDVVRADSKNSRTWGQFFEMIEMEAVAATKAQKKENITLRDQQAQRGILKALEMGLGDWAVSRPGREFVKVETTI